MEIGVSQGAYSIDEKENHRVYIQMRSVLMGGDCLQNRYVADVGDFGKYGMLKMITSCTTSKLGINWYLTDDESHNNDGKHIGYLDDTKRKNIVEFRSCDPILYKQLQEIANTYRTIRSIQNSNVMPLGTVFYDRVLSYHTVQNSIARKNLRKQWYESGYKQLELCDIVYFDPDNGLEVESVGKYKDKGPKYVWHDELTDYYNRGQSLIIYNHRSREPQRMYLKRFDRIVEMASELQNIIMLRYRRGTTRDYVLLMQPSHRIEILGNIKKLIDSPWSRHFSIINLEEIRSCLTDYHEESLMSDVRG